jgi:rRNA-processing protein EBP2
MWFRDFFRLIALCARGQETEVDRDTLNPSYNKRRRLTRVVLPSLKTKDFGWTKKAAWIDHMVVTGAAGVAPIADINDDLQRETSFYERALASAEVAISKLKALGIPTRRPDDFYAEMVKSDEHMKRVRAELIFEQTRQETTDERRKAREQKRYGKQVQAEKLKERTLQKKDSIKNLDKWRKQRKRDGFEDNGAAPEGFEDEKRRNKSSGGGGQHGRSTPESRQKKSFKEEKFGFGGRKRVRFFFSPARRGGFSFPAERFSGPNSPRLAHRRVRGVLPACPDT